MAVVSVGGGCLAYATENGRCFLLGRHVLNNAPQSSTASTSAAALRQFSPAKQTPFVLAGLDNIPVALVALGKTHLVVVGKNGALYATGLNNQNQCGRQTTPAAAVMAPPSTAAISTVEQVLLLFRQKSNCPM
jgi:alpha-tubulin suppressor-like RCC1 family protein